MGGYVESILKIFYLLKSMLAKCIVFAVANSVLEIKHDIANSLLDSLIMVTACSDYSNHVNDKLHFPFVFCAALDV